MKMEYETKMMECLRELDMLDLEGEFDFDGHRMFPFIKLDNRIAHILHPLIKKEGFRIRPFIKYNYKGGKILKSD